MLFAARGSASAICLVSDFPRNPHTSMATALPKSTHVFFVPGVFAGNLVIYCTFKMQHVIQRLCGQDTVAVVEVLSSRLNFSDVSSALHSCAAILDSCFAVGSCTKTE